MLTKAWSGDSVVFTNSFAIDTHLPSRGMPMLDCIFCRIANHEIAATVVYEDEQIMAFEDIDPQAPVHVLLVTKKHVSTLIDLKEDELELLQMVMSGAKTVAMLKNIEYSGFRVVLNCNPDGGQTIYHLHAHVLGGRKMNWPPG